MTNVEFQKRFKDLCQKYPFIGIHIKKTVNELFYMLRMDNSVTDYNVNLITEDNRTLCIPSVRETFIPVSELAMHVKEVECEEDDYGFDGLCLNVYVEE